MAALSTVALALYNCTLQSYDQAFPNSHVGC